MDRISTYALLADKLHQWRAMPRREVVDRAGAAAVVDQPLINAGLVSSEVSVDRTDRSETNLLVKAIAYGPSHWKIERLEESIVLGPMDTEES